ncbi:hypothetical protein SBF1_50036 [Candidatus Desulfosporosinus infrequens]|uniref:Uncharacterized protein n=1 Tax=Candidatus Desulfosporosinus infrequens TaxID=2043169 RepID=A0A2U3LGZ7_9FIRM|nr:hypothetical protein SBF1_50036 [Candidatus Desulfosporosinus infrequens]
MKYTIAEYHGIDRHQMQAHTEEIITKLEFIRTTCTDAESLEYTDAQLEFYREELASKSLLMSSWWEVENYMRKGRKIA